MKISNKTNKQNDVWSKTITDGESDKKINIDNLKMFRLLGGSIPEDGILTEGLADALIANGPDVVIPSGYTSIADSAFKNQTNLTSVTIPDSVTTIGNYAFDSCTGLTSVTIGDSVTAIGTYAFYGCSNLTSVTIPDNVTTIGRYAFRSCNNLTSVNIGNSVTSIGNYVFYNCTSLTSVTIPDSVTTIGDGAFAYCSNLASVTLYEGIQSFGNNVFSNTNLSIVIVYYTDNQPNYDDFSLPQGVEITYQQIGGSTTINLTFEVDASHITVGPNGLYIGGGLIFGDANAVALSDPDGDDIWSVTISSDDYNIASGGNYTILNSPVNGGDYGTKEDISDQSCADANYHNDRILPAITEDTTILLTFGQCCSNDPTGYGHGLCPETTDSTAPVITLNGESTVKIILGEEYIDSGASASDDTDDDLTSSIITVNNVDTSKVGTYYVTYNVNDAAGNVAIEVTRTVIVTLDQNDDDEVNVLDIVAAFNNGNKHLIPSIVDTILGR